MCVQILRANGCKVLGVDFDTVRCKLANNFGIETVDLSKGQDPLVNAKSFSREECRVINSSIVFSGIILNYFLINGFGFYGASISTLIAYLFMAAFLSYKNFKWMNISLNYKILGPYLGLVFLIVGPIQWNENIFVFINLATLMVGVTGFKMLLRKNNDR